MDRKYPNSLFIFSGLECVGHSFAYVAHFFVFLRDVWIQTQILKNTKINLNIYFLIAGLVASLRD
jgi:hypothetical protein